MDITQVQQLATHVEGFVEIVKLELMNNVMMEIQLMEMGVHHHVKLKMLGLAQTNLVVALCSIKTTSP